MMKRSIYRATHPLLQIYWKICKPKTYGSRAIVLCGDHVLLVRHIGIPYWALPGGRIEEGETPEQCILRELKEELNISPSVVGLDLGVYVSNKEGKRDTVHVFVVNITTKDFMKQWELDDARWFALDDLPKNISPAGARRIREFQEGKKGLTGNW